jgi:hypothetical protein
MADISKVADRLKVKRGRSCADGNIAAPYDFMLSAQIKN